jgi:predicted NAD-dependent protein-ADP-ribosyltransferase YbiA (DUF1768 family)
MTAFYGYFQEISDCCWKILFYSNYQIFQLSDIQIMKRRSKPGKCQNGTTLPVSKRTKLLEEKNDEESQLPDIQGHVINFSSSSKAPYNVLSNFFECTLELDGKLYPSTEHWYQSKKTTSPEDFQIGGRFASWSAMSMFWTSNEVEKKIAYWSKKRNIGILAKLAIGRSLKGTKIQKNKINLKLKPHYKFTHLEEAYDYWKPALKAKIDQNPNIKQLLLSKEIKHAYLVEFSRSSERRPGIWAGMVKNGQLYGGNWMGIMLMSLLSEYYSK